MPSQHGTSAFVPEIKSGIPDAEAFPTRLIESLNQRRNILEHEFQLVARDEAEALVEMAELFLVLAYAFSASCGQTKRENPYLLTSYRGA